MQVNRAFACRNLGTTINHHAGSIPTGEIEDSIGLAVANVSRNVGGRFFLTLNSSLTKTASFKGEINNLQYFH